MQSPSLQSMLKRKMPEPFDEERPALGEERLEGVEVDDRRVGLHLAEVGIDGGRQRERRGDGVLHVEAELPRPDRSARSAGRLPRRRSSRFADACTAPARAASASRQRAGRAPRRTATRNPLALRDSSGHVEVSFRRADLANHREAHGSAAAGSKRSCENGMRNSARQPSASRATCDVPHRVPAVVAVAVVEVVAVGLDAGRVHARTRTPSGDRGTSR